MSQKIIYNCDNCGVELDRNGQILSAHSLDELQSQLCEQISEIQLLNSRIGKMQNTIDKILILIFDHRNSYADFLDILPNLLEIDNSIIETMINLSSISKSMREID